MPYPRIAGSSHNGADVTNVPISFIDHLSQNDADSRPREKEAVAMFIRH